jgi:hypothetical protein
MIMDYKGEKAHESGEAYNDYRLQRERKKHPGYNPGENLELAGDSSG